MQKNTPIQMRWQWLNWPLCLRIIIALTAFGTINWLFLAPAKTFEALTPSFPHQDKLAHFILWAGFTGLLHWATPAHHNANHRKIALLSFLLFYGILTECLQAALPQLGRTFAWGDILANLIGIATGTLLFYKLTQRETCVRR